MTYDSPPLVEVAMSVQFDPPKYLNPAHLGAFWATRKDSLPHVRAIPPIATTEEVFSSDGQWVPPSMHFSLTDDPDFRLQMVSADDQWVCQVQRNRLVVNWRKRSDAYPRFGATWQRFQDALRAWQVFLSDLQIFELRMRIWELTYVNRIPRSSLWQKPSDWPNVFPGLWGKCFESVEGAELRGLHGQWVWEIVEPPARLYVEPKPGRFTGDPPEDVLLLSFTSRGPVLPTAQDQNDIDRIKTGMLAGHDLIVGTFDRISSDTAKKAWGRRADTV